MVKLDRKNSFLPPTLNRCSSVEHGPAKLLTFYFTARDRPLSKPHGPWPAGFGEPWNPKSLNLTYFRPSSFTLLDRSVLSLPFIIRLYRPVFVPWIVHFQTEVSIISTSPDFVQSLDFFLSRPISGFRLDQIKTRFESGPSLDKTQKYLSRLSPDWDLAPDLDLDWVWKKLFTKIGANQYINYAA